MSKLSEAIFPIVTFDPDTEVWQCLGTGFFINPTGAFCTAKHLFFIDGKQMEQTLYAIQKISDKEYHVRPITQLVPHTDSDVMIGTLGMRRMPDGKNMEPKTSVYFAMDFEQLDNGDNISTFAYPNTKKDDLESGETLFSFRAKSSKGLVIDV